MGTEYEHVIPEEIEIIYIFNIKIHIKTYSNSFVIREYRMSSYKPVRNRQHIGKKGSK